MRRRAGRQVRQRRALTLRGREQGVVIFQKAFRFSIHGKRDKHGRQLRRPRMECVEEVTCRGRVLFPWAAPNSVAPKRRLEKTQPFSKGRQEDHLKVSFEVQRLQHRLSPRGRQPAPRSDIFAIDVLAYPPYLSHRDGQRRRPPIQALQKHGSGDQRNGRQEVAIGSSRNIARG